MRILCDSGDYSHFFLLSRVLMLSPFCLPHSLPVPPWPRSCGPCSYWQITKRVTAQKGLAGTLDGFVPWGFMQSIAKGSVFSWGQAQSASMMHNMGGLTKEQKTVISGGAGGFVQGVVMSPLLLLKTRVMTDPVFRTTGGLFATAVASARVRAQLLRNGCRTLCSSPLTSICARSVMPIE